MTVLINSKLAFDRSNEVAYHFNQFIYYSKSYTYELFLLKFVYDDLV
jgi:hypothetical protein